MNKKTLRHKEKIIWSKKWTQKIYKRWECLEHASKGRRKNSQTVHDKYEDGLSQSSPPVCRAWKKVFRLI